MVRQLKGLILIFLGISIFFPELFNIFVFKVLLSLILIWTGVNLIFKNNNNNNSKNDNGK